MDCYVTSECPLRCTKPYASALYLFLQDLGVYAGCIVFVALLNSCGLKVLTLCTQLGGMFHLAGIVLLALIVPLMATQHQPASFVFGFYEKEHAEEVGIVNPL